SREAYSKIIVGGEYVNSAIKTSEIQDEVFGTFVGDAINRAKDEQEKREKKEADAKKKSLKDPEVKALKKKLVGIEAKLGKEGAKNPENLREQRRGIIDKLFEKDPDEASEAITKLYGLDFSVVEDAFGDDAKRASVLKILEDIDGLPDATVGKQALRSKFVEDINLALKNKSNTVDDVRWFSRAYAGAVGDLRGDIDESLFPDAGAMFLKNGKVKNNLSDGASKFKHALFVRLAEEREKLKENLKSLVEAGADSRVREILLDDYGISISGIEGVVGWDNKFIIDLAKSVSELPNVMVGGLPLHEVIGAKLKGLAEGFKGDLGLKGEEEISENSIKNIRSNLLGFVGAWKDPEIKKIDAELIDEFVDKIRKGAAAKTKINGLWKSSVKVVGEEEIGRFVGGAVASQKKRDGEYSKVFDELKKTLASAKFPEAIISRVAMKSLGQGVKTDLASDLSSKKSRLFKGALDSNNIKDGVEIFIEALWDQSKGLNQNQLQQLKKFSEGYINAWGGPDISGPIDADLFWKTSEAAYGKIIGLFDAKVSESDVEDLDKKIKKEVNKIKEQQEGRNKYREKNLQFGRDQWKDVLGDGADKLIAAIGTVAETQLSREKFAWNVGSKRSVFTLRDMVGNFVNDALRKSSHNKDEAQKKNLKKFLTDFVKQWKEFGDEKVDEKERIIDEEIFNSTSLKAYNGILITSDKSYGGVIRKDAELDTSGLKKIISSAEDQQKDRNRSTAAERLKKTLFGGSGAAAVAVVEAVADKKGKAGPVQEADSTKSRNLFATVGGKIVPLDKSPLEGFVESRAGGGIKVDSRIPDGPREVDPAVKVDEVGNAQGSQSARSGSELEKKEIETQPETKEIKGRETSVTGSDGADAEELATT
ncbi:hypothetical protein HOD08_01230, partial [bacterium]|nr:hypothetical protein [bacterium]